MAADKAWRITGKILKYASLTLVFGVIIFLVWRMLSSGDPQSVKTLIVNDATYQAYADDEKLEVLYQEQNSITRADNNYGYFSVTQASLIPEAEQIQVVFRYNNSTLEALKNDYGLPSRPERELDLYDISIVVVTDLTPDNSDDNEGDVAEAVKKTRYFPTVGLTVSDKKTMYNYRKFVFDGVPIGSLTEEGDIILAIYVDIYYKEDIDYERNAYGTLCIWDYASTVHTRKLSGKDIDALESAR